ncbi:hypothetical protein FHS96_000243 [Sphingomonas zeicaulis]|uniref:type II toxin-antitoxin system VapC family toxin n=1 Tax=Sphingomonas zeicaulis TaxID=1632740 RepID=UPI003D1AF75B
MIMVDTNVVIDLLECDPKWYGWSLQAVSNARSGHDIVASAVVVAELAYHLTTRGDAMDVLRAFGISTLDLGAKAALGAGLAHQAYRKAGGKRDKILADFLIGAHAVDQADALITRDPRHYRSYFPALALISPSKDDHD